MKTKYGRLTVLALSHRDHRHRKFYLCRCDCGAEKTVQAHLLSCGNTRSCGCLSKDSKAAQRLPGNHSEVTAIILGYKRHAKSRGYGWRLTRDQVEKIIRRPCFYCGSQPQNTKAHKNTISPLAYSGIDRVDNGVGYSPENVVPCCRICNRAKFRQSLAEFAAWAKRLGAMAEQWGSL